MKHTRVFAAFLALLMMLSLVACGSKSSGTNDTTGANQPASITESSSSETANIPDLPSEERLFEDYMTQASQEFDFTHVVMENAEGMESGTATIYITAYAEELVYGDIQPAIGYKDARAMTYTLTGNEWTYNGIDSGSNLEKYMLPSTVTLFSREWIYDNTYRNMGREWHHVDAISIQISEDANELEVLSGQYNDEQGNASGEFFPCTMELSEIKEKPLLGLSSGQSYIEYVYEISSAQDGFSREVADYTEGQASTYEISVSYSRNKDGDVRLEVSGGYPGFYTFLFVEEF